MNSIFVDSAVFVITLFHSFNYSQNFIIRTIPFMYETNNNHNILWNCMCYFRSSPPKPVHT